MKKRIICLILSVMLVLSCSCKKAPLDEETAESAAIETNQDLPQNIPQAEGENENEPEDIEIKQEDPPKDDSKGVIENEGESDVRPQTRPENKFVVSDEFKNAQFEFCTVLLKEAAKDKKQNNVLISPLSVSLALSIAATGAKGETRTEMQNLLAKNSEISMLSQNYSGYLELLSQRVNNTLKISNSVWLRNDNSLNVKEGFINSSKNFYGADVFKKKFNDATVKEINDWVKQKTDGQIEKIIDGLDENAVACIINALSFDALWEDQYRETSVSDGEFTDVSGNKQKVSMMSSQEFNYIETDEVTGFKKYYKGYDYSFVALLPKKQVGVDGFIEGLTAQKLESVLNFKSASTKVKLPKFSDECSFDMKTMLENMGMPTAFDAEKADFSDMATSTGGNIFINKVIHKTTITVCESGTRAGAATVILDKCGGIHNEHKYVTLDRPFVYMIMDEKMGVPVFIGTCKTVKGL